MSRATLLLATLSMVACMKKEAPPADTSLAVAPEAAAPAAMDYAGNWSVQVMPAAKDTVLLTYDLVSTNETTGWSLTLPGREAMSPRIVSMSSDSVIIDNGPYASALRNKVMVTTHSSMHMEGDKLVGNTVAHYDTKRADSVVNLRTVATRK